MISRKARLAAVALGVALFATGCGTHASGPDPTGDNVTQGTNPHVIQEPYGYRNVSFSCFGPNGVYVTSRSVGSDLASGIAVVPNDPQCKR